MSVAIRGTRDETREDGGNAETGVGGHRGEFGWRCCPHNLRNIGLIIEREYQNRVIRCKRRGLHPVSHRRVHLLFLPCIQLAFFLYAGLAALVKRQEEVQSAIMLPQVPMISGYLLFFLAVFTPDATLTKVLSYIPLWTPWMMLARIARGTVAWWELVVTPGLLQVAILVCTRFAARLCRVGVLMYGQRPGPGQLLKLVQGKEG